MKGESMLFIFEERAEHLPKEDFLKWSILTEKEDLIVSKLKSPGLKLLSGPRGSGKSTLLLRAYYEMYDSLDVIPAYVNFSRSISLEPLFKNKGNAASIFRQWVIGKILSSIEDYFRNKSIAIPDNLRKTIKYYEVLVNSIDNGVIPEDFRDSLSVKSLVSELANLCEEAGRLRCVLLLDDAAHAFSVEQQKEFFEIFADLKSHKVSAKAAVYPGITSYSPTFHVGHDAEIINVWYNPDEPEYLKLMTLIINKRLPGEILGYFEGKQNIIDLLALASFGIPRLFINMIARVTNAGDQGKPKIDRITALRAIKEQSDVNLGVFSSIKDRISRYSKFVDFGDILYGKIIDKIKQSNSRNSRANSIGIEIGLPQNIDKVLGLMEYAGIIRNKGEVSQGDVGKFKRYQIHYSNLIAKNAMGQKTSYSVEDIVDFYSNRSGAKFPLVKISGLMSDDEIASCILELPPCSVCDTKRISDNQKFCMNCGSQLINPSIYLEMINANISYLSIPSKKKTKLIESGRFSKVGDIIIDDEQNLMSIKGIGPYWSKKIKLAAEEFVNA